MLQNGRDVGIIIYGVATIDEDIEIMTEVPAGKLQNGGANPEDMIRYVVKGHLEKMSELARFRQGQGQGLSGLR